MKKLLIIAASIALLMTGCNEDAPMMVKDKDGNVYKTVKVGNQIWMAQNLKVQTEGSWCYDNDPANCEKYGRLYTWNAATNACPEGWSLPNNEDWETLKNFAEEKEGSGKAGKFLKLGGASGLGFLLAGDKYSKKFQLLDSTGYYWSSTDEDATHAYDWVLFASKDDMIAGNIKYGIKANGLSVRCIMKSGIKSDDQAADEVLEDSRDDIIYKNVPIETEKKIDSRTTKGTFKDSRDGKTYKTVKIGNLTWMAENLNYETRDSYCYEDNKSNCAKYGRLYTWAAAMDSMGTWSSNGKGCGNGKKCSPAYPVRGVCPAGWHLPGVNEWVYLRDVVAEDYQEADKKLKSTYGWNENKGKSGNGTNDFGFSALPAGYLYERRSYNGEGEKTFFWSSTEDGSHNAHRIELWTPWFWGKGNAASVRCVRDYFEDENIESTQKPPKMNTVKDSRDGKIYKIVKIGNQTWMAENLNYKTEYSYCLYDIASNCTKYGRLYTWGAAMDGMGIWSSNGKGCDGYGEKCSPKYPVRGVCPEGWHLPSNDEWNDLFKAAFGREGAGEVLKSRSDWKKGMDGLGFSALRAGTRAGSGHYFLIWTTFWSSTWESYVGKPYHMHLSDESDAAHLVKRSEFSSYGDALSVRCLKD